MRLQKNINNSQLQKAEIQLSDGQIFGRFVTKAQNFRYKTLRYEFLQLSSHKDTQTYYVPFSSMLSVLMVILLSSACITVLPLWSWIRSCLFFRMIWLPVKVSWPRTLLFSSSALNEIFRRELILSGPP